MLADPHGRRREVAVKERRVRETFYRVFGAGLPTLEPGERIVLSLGGWIDGAKSGGSGRIVLTNRRLLNVRQVVEPLEMRVPAAAKQLSIHLGDIVEFTPITRHRRFSWLRHRFRLRLVLKTGERLTVVTGGAQRPHDELVRLRAGAAEEPG